ncbi:MAG TPA: right-handed parallel beta-helix repeat-containing protein [Opitutaceae bacterium]|nr:right-handed parallel beta-helix repeat-containing protein [Opitutaceae bacterium]
MNYPNIACGALCALALAASAAAFPITSHLYIQPGSEPFIEESGEQVVTVTDSSGSISTAQSAINSARSAHPSAILVIHLNATTYTVSSTPLVLTSNECLVLGGSTTIAASSSSATAAALISVTSQDHVSIAGGTLDAKGANMDCIAVTTSNRVNIDSVTAKNAKLDGILVTGHGATSFDNELTVTRCTVTGGTSTHYGISLQNASQAVIIDNTCSDNAGGGIYLSSNNHCTVTNNTFEDNGIDAIHVVSGTGNFISDNQMDGNPVGISLGSGSSGNIVASNHPYTCSTVGISEAGTGDTIFENYYKGNTSDFSSGGSGNHVMAYKAALSAPSQDYFYPPIFANQHTTTTIVNGLGRYDLTIGATSISSVQSQYNSALSAHPNTVIVLHLTGTNYTGGNSPLTLSSNTCVLLTGKISMPSSSTATSAVTAASGSSHISFSGGTIDGGGRGGFPGINFNGCHMVWVQGTILQNFGVPTTRTNDGILDIHSPGGPAFVSSCTVNNGGGRGIWTEGTGPFVITDNTCSNVNMDGIDCDSRTSLALVKFNTCDNNTRCGCFIEQGATFVHLIANAFSGNGRSAFSVWNNGVSGNEPATQDHTLACNDCVSGGIGFETGSQSGSPYVENVAHNFFFNNSASSNQTGQEDSTIGQGSSGSNSVQNYYGQNYVHDNTTDLDLSPGGLEVFFNSSEP